MRDECRAAPRDAASRATGSNDKECNMAAEKSQSVQDVFLNKIRKDKTPVTVFLVNGVKLQGIVTWLDNFCLLLRRDAHRSEEHTSELQSLMRISYAVFCLKKKQKNTKQIGLKVRTIIKKQHHKQMTTQHK